MRRGSFDIFTIVAFLFLVFMIANAIIGGGNRESSPGAMRTDANRIQTNPYQAFLPLVMNTRTPPEPTGQPQGAGGLGKVQLRVVTNPFNPSGQPLGDPAAFAAPYEDYIITQGLHGFSYGHMAVDLAAGEDAPILSPINGVVTALYIDEYGNPNLILENEVYQVLLMHGKYSLQVGDAVAIGDPVGKESNLGYTTDMNGRPCRNRDCGYHSHLNVFDKRLGQNVNPLDLISSN